MAVNDSCFGPGAPVINSGTRQMSAMSARARQPKSIARVWPCAPCYFSEETLSSDNTRTFPWPCCFFTCLCSRTSSKIRPTCPLPNPAAEGSWPLRSSCEAQDRRVRRLVDELGDREVQMRNMQVWPGRRGSGGRNPKGSARWPDPNMIQQKGKTS